MESCSVAETMYCSCRGTQKWVKGMQAGVRYRAWSILEPGRWQKSALCARLSPPPSHLSETHKIFLEKQVKGLRHASGVMRGKTEAVAQSLVLDHESRGLRNRPDPKGASSASTGGATRSYGASGFHTQCFCGLFRHWKG